MTSAVTGPANGTNTMSRSVGSQRRLSAALASEISAAIISTAFRIAADAQRTSLGLGINGFIMGSYLSAIRD